jgi:signal transduction histidine kinase
VELPPLVIGYLQGTFLERSRPFCALLDEDYCLVSKWGEADWCGFGELDSGTDVREAAPFLVGTRLDERQAFDFMELPGGVVVSAHIIPQHGECYVLILDVHGEHASVQSRQQSVNELRLLQSRQQTLISRQRDLISELVEAKAALDHHRREAERTSDNKGRFIAMMSHEFRTPLSSIINYAEIATDPESSGNDVQKGVETISRSAQHLNSLVEAILDDASLDAGQVELINQDFDLYELLGDVAAMMAPMAAEKGISFAVRLDDDVPNTVHADEVRLRQILINLLGNAVKFTQEGSVELLVAHNAGRLVVTISDTGPGISPEDQERVFQAFERGDQRRQAGAGLGLSITLQLVKLMGGEVSLDSARGEGCTVSVHVPVVERNQAGSDRPGVLPTPDDSTRATKSVSVLICDDDDDMVALVEHYLHRSGYGLITSHDSSEAIEKTLKYDPDLVLMDCNVPGVGGVVAAKVLRERGFTKPIVALTASRLQDEEQRVFSHFFRKPAPMQDLLAEIKRLTH